MARGFLAGLAQAVRAKVYPVRCSFCRRPSTDVRRLVAGPSVYICDACVTSCVAVLEKHCGFAQPATSR